MLGGFLADYVFEPYMNGEHAGSRVLSHLVGNGAGTGMAVMFLCTGVLGSLLSFLFYRNRKVRALREAPEKLSLKS